MKKIISLLLSLALVFSLAGCGNQPDGSSSQINSGVVSETIVSNSEVTDDSQKTDDSRIQPESSPQSSSAVVENQPAIDEDGRYFDKENVALYIHTYGKLPYNFITKDEARDLGWDGGSVEKYAPGYAIGGDRFGNYEGLLPKKKGRTYTECDIDTDGYHSRGSRRIVFSNDGLIYYTHDHYESFELLYGEE